MRPRQKLDTQVLYLRVHVKGALARKIKDNIQHMNIYILSFYSLNTVHVKVCGKNSIILHSFSYTVHMYMHDKTH